MLPLGVMNGSRPEGPCGWADDGVGAGGDPVLAVLVAVLLVVRVAVAGALFWPAAGDACPVTVLAHPASTDPSRQQVTTVQVACFMTLPARRDDGGRA
jgi:hypothetical protein